MDDRLAAYAREQRGGPVGTGLQRPTFGHRGARPAASLHLAHRAREHPTGPPSSALPDPGSTEDRQLTRWVAQVVLTEELCGADAAARGLDTEG
ncbi:hypothetical protein UK12_35005, partial [Saccharothrix sp. ST-888]